MMVFSCIGALLSVSVTRIHAPCCSHLVLSHKNKNSPLTILSDLVVWGLYRVRGTFVSL